SIRRVRGPCGTQCRSSISASTWPTPSSTPRSKVRRTSWPTARAPPAPITPFRAAPLTIKASGAPSSAGSATFIRTAWGDRPATAAADERAAQPRQCEQRAAARGGVLRGGDVHADLRQRDAAADEPHPRYAQQDSAFRCVERSDAHATVVQLVVQ